MVAAIQHWSDKYYAMLAYKSCSNGACSVGYQLHFFTVFVYFFFPFMVYGLAVGFRVGIGVGIINRTEFGLD